MPPLALDIRAYYPALCMQRAGHCTQALRRNRRQIAGQDQPAVGIGRQRHAARNGVAHAFAAPQRAVFHEHRAQAAGLDGCERVFQHAAAMQPGLQFTGLGARSPKALALPRGQHHDDGCLLVICTVHVGHCRKRWHASCSP